MSRKFKFHYNLKRIIDTLHKDLCTFTFACTFVRMKNVSEKSCTENQNTHSVFNNIFPKIVPFMR
jgi:hypothetical protein